MPAKLNYTDNLKDYLRIEPTIESDVVRELRAHIEDKCHELVESGLPEEEAKAKAVQLLGSPRLVAQQVYEVYSQGNWRQAIFAALPHFLVAALFALHWWQNTIWLLGILCAVICFAIYGWCHGKPAWLFPWLGYCLIPVIAVGVLLIYLSDDWAWLATVAYIPLALLVIFPVTKQTIKRDWLFASLMLLPIPIVIGWTLALGVGNKLLWHEHLYEVAPLIALSFAVLAITAATFIRIRQRWAKFGILFVIEILVLMIVASGNRNTVGFGGWLLLALLASFLLLVPALLDRKIREAGEKPARLSPKSPP